MQEVAAGYNTIDFLDSHAANGGTQLYKANLLYALDEIPNIDMSDNKYGSARFLQYGIFDGRNYGFYQFAWEFPPEYQGVIHLSLVNTSEEDVHIEYGQKIIQFILLPVFYDTLEEVENESKCFTETTERGSGAFGSTGTK